MKTIKKTIALLSATFFSAFAFAQLNLGLQSTTQAAINATVNAGSVIHTTGAIANATKSTVQATTARTVTAATKVSAAANTNARQGISTTTEIKDAAEKNADINAGANFSANNETSTPDPFGNHNVPVEQKNSSSINTSAGLQVTGSSTINQAKSNTQTAAMAEAKTIKGVGNAAKSGSRTNLNTSSNTDIKTNINKQ